MKRDDLVKLACGDFIFFAKDGSFVSDNISHCEDLTFGKTFDSNQSHFGMMVNFAEIVEMNPMHPYRRNIASLSDEELTRITAKRPYLPPFLADSVPFAPGLDLGFQRILNRVVLSHMDDTYNFPLIGWFLLAKMFDKTGCQSIAEYMYKRNRDSNSNFWECACWGVRNWNQAVWEVYGLKIDIDGELTGRGQETPASVAGSPWLANI